MANTVYSNGGVLAEKLTYWDSIFLNRAEAYLRYDELCTKKQIPENSGPVIYFTRMTPRTVSTSAATEGANPTAVVTSSVNVTSEVQEFTDNEAVSSRFYKTGLDKGIKERIEIHGQQAGETVDTVIRDSMYTNATVQFAGGKAALTAVASTDTLTVLELRKAIAKLKRNKAWAYDGGVFKMVASTTGYYDLLGDTNQGNFTTANQFGTPEMIKKGYVGRIGGTDVFESNSEKYDDNGGASSADVFSNFIAGREAYAMVDVVGSEGQKVFVKKPDSSSTNDPANMIAATIAWKVMFSVAPLNTNWIINIKSGAPTGTGV